MHRAAILLLAVLLAASPARGARRDLREYSPSALLRPGESELKLFHNLYTQTEFFDDDGSRVDQTELADEDGDGVDQGVRSTWYTGTGTLRWGWRPRLNGVLEITVRAVKDETRRSDFDGRSGLTAFSPRVQLLPWNAVPSLTLQTGFRIPLGSELEGDGKRPFLDFADPFWTAQLLYDRSVSPSVRLYLEGGGFVRMSGDDSQLTTPVKAIFNYEPSAAWSLYLPAEISPDWLGDASGNYFTQVGVGAKLRPGDGATELEALWTVFPAGRNAGAGQTFNLGIRFVR